MRVALVLVVAACGAPSGPTSYQVTYQVTGTVHVTFDSVMYEDAQGTLVKVAAPPSGWFVAFPAMTGDYVQAFAWTRVTVDGGAAKLKPRPMPLRSSCRDGASSLPALQDEAYRVMCEARVDFVA